MKIEKEIEVLKDRLNYLLDMAVNPDEIYEVSVKLDRLIVQYYKKKYRIKINDE